MDKLTISNPSSNDTTSTDKRWILGFLFQRIGLIRVHPCDPWLKNSCRNFGHNGNAADMDELTFSNPSSNDTTSTDKRNRENLTVAVPISSHQKSKFNSHHSAIPRPPIRTTIRRKSGSGEPPVPTSVTFSLKFFIFLSRPFA